MRAVPAALAVAGVRKAARRRVTAAVASGLQIVKRVRVGMRGTLQPSTPVQKRASGEGPGGPAWPDPAPVREGLVTAEWRSCDRGGRGQVPRPGSQ
ncbi:hypothetical protein GCM10010335_07250 [Streptomyces galbus]|nr:hypothetical protein GCM10010335_07250 [Streptomyces galbus]